MKISEDIKIIVSFVACISYIASIWLYTADSEVCPLGSNDAWTNDTYY